MQTTFLFLTEPQSSLSLSLLLTHTLASILYKHTTFSLSYLSLAILKMPNKNLHLCFTRPTTPDSSPTSKHQDHFNHLSSNITTSSSPTRTTAATTTTAAAAAATTSCSSSSDLIKNFNSLYDNTPASTSNSLSRTSDDFSTSDSETDQSTTPDFATIFASQRFFFSSPGRSNSIVESSSSICQSQSSLSDSPPESSTSSDTLVAGGVPTPTYSPDPYMDFRRSMQEMVEDRKLSDVTTDWDFLHELLLCYLALNPKHAHKYIIGAFADLLISLMASDDSRRREQSDDISSRQQ